MSRLQSGFIVVLLALPFGVYIAYQAQSAVPADLIGAGAPSEKGLPEPEQLAAHAAKAEKWAGEVRKVSAVGLQFRAAGAGDKVADEDAKAVVQAAADRAADLGDLEKFLARVDDPKFTGKMKDRYRGWYDETKALRTAAADVERWLSGRVTALEGAAAAEGAIKQFNQLLDAYTKGNSIFIDRGLVAGWRVRAHARIIEGLSTAARQPFKAVLELPLPLPSAETNADVRTAVGALREMKVQVDLLLVLTNKAKADGIVLSREAQDARTKALDAATEWAAGDELLGLFADPELFTDPRKAAEWLPKVQAQLNKTQSASQELIRKKVRQFCDAYIPKAALLDEEVLIEDKPQPRKGVVIEYDSDAKTKPLGERHDEVTEFNFRTAHKNFDSILWANRAQRRGNPEVLKPTPKSLLAQEYTEARAGVEVWTAAGLERLKKRCEGSGGALQQEERRNLTDELVGYTPAKDGKEPAGAKWDRDNSKIWTRLLSLSAAMSKYPALFEDKR